MPGPSLCGPCLGPSLCRGSGFAANLRGTCFHIADHLTPRFVGLPGISVAAGLLDACISVAAGLRIVSLFAGYFTADRSELCGAGPVAPLNSVPVGDDLL
ncbi:hypothetical protein AMECASPLE_038886, partial [Ameca splendens]